jgi:DNA repair protein RecO (recombination protein O)
MSVLTSEAVILRTWPVHEADLLVSFFTRDYGRLKGMAKAALKSRKRFGGALEPMTLARAWFAERPRQELVRLDQLEILRSPLSAPVDQTRMAVLSFYAEVIDEALPERDPQATVFRLVASVLEQTNAVNSDARSQDRGLHPTDEHLSAGTPRDLGHPERGPWMALTYFSLWMTRLMGLLPDIGRCMVCGETLGAGEVRFNAYADGLFCGLHANGSGSGLSSDSWQLAQRMLRAPASSFAGEAWPRKRGQDLRRFTLQTLERHLERKLKTAEAIARLGG